jgi:hypothetical protein
LTGVSNTGRRYELSRTTGAAVQLNPAEPCPTRPIAVERAMYSNANGQFWAAGTNAAATRLP